MHFLDEKNYIRYPLLSEDNLENYIKKFNLELDGNYKKKIYFYYLLQNIISSNSVAFQNNDLGYYLYGIINNKSNHDINKILVISKYTLKELKAYLKISEYAVSTYNSNDHDFNKIIRHIKNSNWLTGPYVYSKLKLSYNRINDKILKMKKEIGVSDNDNINIRKYIFYINKSINEFHSLRKRLTDTFKAINIKKYKYHRIPIRDYEKKMAIFKIFEQLYEIKLEKMDFSNFYLSEEIVQNFEDLIKLVSSGKNNETDFIESKEKLIESMKYGFRNNSEFVINDNITTINNSMPKRIVLPKGRGNGC